MRTLFKNIEYKIETGILDNYGQFATGLTVTYDVRKASDNSLVTSGTTTEISGIYSYTYTFAESIEYRSKLTTPSGYEDGFENIVVIDALAKDADLTAHRTETENRIKYILGLEQHNFRIKNQVYNSDNLLLSSTIRLYNSASDANADINPLKEYSMEATYDSDGKITSYKVIEV